jgi:hypothetical protein
MSAENFFAAAPKCTVVEVEDYEGVYARELSAGEKDIWEKNFGKDDVRTRTVILCVCDANGNRVLNTKDHKKKVADLPVTYIDAVLEAFKKANHLDAEEAKGIEKE